MFGKKKDKDKDKKETKKEEKKETKDSKSTSNKDLKKEGSSSFIKEGSSAAHTSSPAVSPQINTSSSTKRVSIYDTALAQLPSKMTMSPSSSMREDPSGKNTPTTEKKIALAELDDILFSMKEVVDTKRTASSSKLPKMSAFIEEPASLSTIRPGNPGAITRDKLKEEMEQTRARMYSTSEADFDDIENMLNDISSSVIQTPSTQQLSDSTHDLINQSLALLKDGQDLQVGPSPEEERRKKEKEEEDRKRKEEEEEQARIEEEQRKRVEEQRRRVEEQKRKIEEQKKKIEEEQRRLMEDMERKMKEEQEEQRRGEESERQEEAKRKLEEEEHARQDQLRREEEEVQMFIQVQKKRKRMRKIEFDMNRKRNFLNNKEKKKK